MRRSSLSVVFLVIVIAPVVNAQSKTVRIGMAKTFLIDKPKSYIDIATDDFKDVMKKATGLDGVVDTKHGPIELAEQIDQKKFDFGIFYSHEFAWVQKKHPELQPLLIAATKERVDRAHVIVQKSSAAKSIADLRGKKFDVPMGASEPCRLFLQKLCQKDAEKAPAMYFAAIEKSQAQSDALDAVARGGVQGAVVDTFALEFYKEVKGPVFAKNLRVLVESEAFPPAVIVYKRGALDDATLKQFRDGLRKAHEIPMGRDMMKTWNVDAFEPVPKDYDKSLVDVLKSYPAPSSGR